MNLVSAVIVAFASAITALTGTHVQMSPLAALSLMTPKSDSTATVIFGGDMMFDRSVRSVFDKNGGDHLFSCIDPTLRQADMVVANLEGPITDNASLSLNSIVGSAHNFIFTFPLTTADLLKAHHVDVVNTGNNHILNFGTAGLNDTYRALEDGGVAYFGQAAGLAYVYRITINDVPLEFINYNQFGGAATTTIEQIKRARGDGFLPIVYTHWGIEYATTSPEYVHALAHQFVDAGAIAVIGSHPHVVEDKETYKGAPIYYSIGNFIFDQYWDEQVTHGLLLKFAFDTTGIVDVKEIPIVLNNDRTVCPDTQSNATITATSTIERSSAATSTSTMSNPQSTTALNVGSTSDEVK